MIASVCLLFGTYRKYKYFYNGKLDWDQRSSKGKYVRENCKRLKVGMFTKWKGKTYWKNFIPFVSIHMINLLWNNFFLLSFNKKDLRICVLFVVLCVVEMTFFIGLKFDNLISIYSLINTAYVFQWSWESTVKKCLWSNIVATDSVEVVEILLFWCMNRLLRRLRTPKYWYTNRFDGGKK